MSEKHFWRLATFMLIIGLFYVGSGIDNGESISLPTVSNKAYGGVTTANENTKIVFTASPDGRKIYMWRYADANPPRYIGEAEAVLSQ